MLKLEKIGRSRDIHVSFRNKPRFFNRTFLLALTIALCFHLLALVIFHIPPFKIGYQESVFSPAFVITDFLDGLLVEATSLHVEEDNIPAYLVDIVDIKPKAEAITPQLPKDLWAKDYSPLLLSRQNALGTSFETLLEPCYALQLLTEPQPLRAITVHISGSLADSAFTLIKDYQQELLDKVVQGKITNIGFTRRFCYQVQAENMKGEIFWWETVLADGEPALQEIALQILKDLRFQHPHPNVTQKGDVEIVLTPFLVCNKKALKNDD